MSHTPRFTPVRVLPDVPTVKLSPSQRALGRLTQVNVTSEPEGAAQRDLAGDLFYEYFLGQVETAAPIPPERAVNRQLIDWLKSTHGWQAGRASTTANLPASLTAAALAWAHLSNEETVKEALKQQEEAAAAARDAKTKKRAADALEAAGDPSAGDARQQAEMAQIQAEGLAAVAQAIITEAQGKPLQQVAMAAIARAAAEQAKEVALAAAGWGMGPGSHIQTDPAAALAFLKHNSGKVAQIAKLAGRLRGYALQSRREAAPAGIVPAGVGYTRDLSRVFPTELAMLRPDAPPALRARKAAEFASRGLLGYTTAADHQERGPFVAAVDVSPSMHGAREIVAKAIALGVAQVAAMEQRPYLLFAFASDRRTITAVSSEEGWPEHLKWAGSSQSGGTDFDMALDETMIRLRQLKAAVADALFVSDGEAGVLSQTRYNWNAFAQDSGARLFYVPVGRGYLRDIDEMADQVINVADLDEATGADLAAALGRWL